MLNTLKQQPQSSLYPNLPIIIPTRQQPSHRESSKSLYKDDTDSSRMSINPQQLANNRKRSIISWEPKEPSFQEVSSLKKYLKKGQEINKYNVKNLSKFQRGENSVKSLLYKFSKDLSIDKFVERDLSLEKVQQENIKNIYLKNNQKNKTAINSRLDKFKTNKKPKGPNEDLNKSKKRNSIPVSQLSKHYVNQEVQTQKQKNKTAMTKSSKIVDKANNASFQKNHKQSHTTTKARINDLKQFENQAGLIKNQKLTKFINLSSILEKDQQQPQPAKRLNNIRNNHMPTKYLLNQSYNYTAQQSTAPSLLSNSYLETMSKLSNTFNEDLEKLRKNRRYDYDQQKMIGANTIDVIPQHKKTLEDTQIQSNNNQQFSEIQIQPTIPLFKNKNVNKKQRKNQSQQISLISKKTNNNIAGNNLDEENWTNKLQEKRSMSIIAEQSENANSNTQKYMNQDKFNNLNYSKTNKFHQQNVQNNQMRNFTQSPIINSEYFEFSNNNFTKALNSKDQIMQFPQVSEVKVSPINISKNMPNTHSIHPVRNNFNQSSGMSWITQNYRPKSQILSQMKFDNFQMKKYKNGVYFGQLLKSEETQQEIKQGYGVIFYFNGKLYEGEFKDDMKSGKGYQQFPDGSKYHGQFQKGFKNGKGIFQWPNGEVYQGQWLNGKKSGSGMWKSSNGQSYIGQWNDGLVEGFGVFVTKNGDRYQGQFIKSQKSGLGTQRFSNGQTYVGQYKRNRPNGKGQYFYSNGDYYKGQFSNHLRHGQGYFKTHKDETVYQGQFRNDKKSGYGQLQKNGTIYSGNFQNDLRHGYGELYQNQQCIYKGFWVNDKEIQNSETPIQDLNKAVDKLTQPISEKPQLKKISKKAKINQHLTQFQDNSDKKTSTINATRRTPTRIISKSKSPVNRSLEKSQNSIERQQYKRSCGCSRRH